MSSFFTAPASQRKRKRTDDKFDKSNKRKNVQQKDSKSQRAQRDQKRAGEEDRDESISGSESEDRESVEVSPPDSEATSEGDDTVAERRARLAKRYLDNTRDESDAVGFDAREIDKELISQRGREATGEKRARRYQFIASQLNLASATYCLFRADTNATTAVAISAPYVYTVSKDKTLIKWQLVPPDIPSSMKSGSPPLRRRPRQLAYVKGSRSTKLGPLKHGHDAPIISLAVSPCGTYLATGSSTDRKLIIWSSVTLEPLHTFHSHRDAVTALSFAPQSQPELKSIQPGSSAQLFSGSADRSIKTYSLNGTDSLAYVETLFGHQDQVLGIASLDLDHCVSVGARDRTARYWKVVEETQSVFKADSSRNAMHATGSVDCVAALSPAYFVTGSDSGAIQLWNVHRKKPISTVECAHGLEEPEPLEKVSSEASKEVLDRLRKVDTRKPVARGITALAAVPSTDVVLSGSWDGWIRIWRISEDKRSLLPVGAVAMKTSMSTTIAGQGVLTNGVHDHSSESTLDNEIGNEAGENEKDKTEAVSPIRGIVNSLAVLGRRNNVHGSLKNHAPINVNKVNSASHDSLDGASDNDDDDNEDDEITGLCIVAGTGKEPRLGRWTKFAGGRNGAVVMEVPVLLAKQRQGMSSG